MRKLLMFLSASVVMQASCKASGTVTATYEGAASTVVPCPDKLPINPFQSMFVMRQGFEAKLGLTTNRP